MTGNNYDPQAYWDDVAASIQQRGQHHFLAGDNDPFYRYKRKKFLHLLDSISFEGKKIIEIGPGPGGNLLEIYKKNPLQLTGADISLRMLEIAREQTAGTSIQLVHFNGTRFTFNKDHFDIAITVTVLQHITDNKVLSELISSICNITGEEIYIFERIEKRSISNATNSGRTIAEYSDLFTRGGMILKDHQFLNVFWSQLFCGLIRKVFNSRKRKEGEPQTRISLALQKFALIFTTTLDHWFPVKKDLAMLHFRKNVPGTE